MSKNISACDASLPAWHPFRELWIDFFYVFFYDFQQFIINVLAYSLLWLLRGTSIVSLRRISPAFPEWVLCLRVRCTLDRECLGLGCVLPFTLCRGIERVLSKHDNEQFYPCTCFTCENGKLATPESTQLRLPLPKKDMCPTLFQASVLNVTLKVMDQM